MKTDKPKRKKPFAATNASIKHLEKQGFECWPVESVIPHTFIKRDCYGFADLLIHSPDGGIALVQVTGGATSSNFHARARKIKAEPLHETWLKSKGRIFLHSWEKQKGTNERKLRAIEITLEETV